jgi:hypothetical protein
MLRVIWLNSWDLTDMTYTVTPGAIYSVLEPTLGVVNACLPTIKPAVSKIFGHQSTGAPSTGNIASIDSRNIRKSQNSKGLYTRQFERLEDDVTLIDIRSGPPSGTNASDPNMNANKDITVSRGWAVYSE